MTWLVFGVSCLLVLAGAVSIISGAPMIQLERGWAEVISGTVALAGGGIVFALAAILMRLEAIRDTLAARMLPVSTEAKPAADALEASPPASLEAVAPPAPARPEEAKPAEPEPDQAGGPDLKEQALWKRVKRADGDRPTADALRQDGFPDRIASGATDEPAPSGVPSVIVPPHAAPAADASAPLPAAEPAPAPRDAGQLGWLERSLFKGRTARGDDLSAPSIGDAMAGGGRREPAMPAPPSAPVASRTPDPAAGAEPQPTPDLASEQHDGATVVGRYQAGSASYVMYSDGTIEVETESGETHRFGSMDELKAFIAQQDLIVP